MYPFLHKLDRTSSVKTAWTRVSNRVEPTVTKACMPERNITDRIIINGSLPKALLYKEIWEIESLSAPTIIYNIHLGDSSTSIACRVDFHHDFSNCPSRHDAVVGFQSVFKFIRGIHNRLDNPYLNPTFSFSEGSGK